MKRFLIYALIILMCFSVSACKDKAETQNKTPVVINLPEDDSVNGYRTEEPNYANNDIVDADSVTVDADSHNSSVAKQVSSTQNSSQEYCVNINSGIFHKADCGSVSKIKEENIAYFSDREKIISEGYTPCKRCNP